MKFKIEPEAALIVKIPRNLLSDCEKLSKQRGFKNSREFLAHFVKKQISMMLNIKKDDPRIKDIH